MQYVQINVGRNVGKRPMSDRRWEDFVNACKATLAGWGVAPPYVAYGERDGEEYAFIAVWGVPPVYAGSYKRLKRTIRHIAATYRQKNFAIVVGQTVLVKSKHIDETEKNRVINGVLAT